MNHPAVFGLAYGDAGELSGSFEKVVYLRETPGKGDPMDWIHDAACHLGVKLEQQSPQIDLSSFDFVRTQRFGISRMARPRIAIASVSGDGAGWSADHRKATCQLLCEKMSAGLVWVGDRSGQDAVSGKDLRGKLMAREIAAVLKQCDLLIGEDEEIAALATAVKTPTLFICRKSWDCWPAEPGAQVVSLYPGRPEEVLEAIGRLRSGLCAPDCKKEETKP